MEVEKQLSKLRVITMLVKDPGFVLRTHVESL